MKYKLECLREILFYLNSTRSRYIERMEETTNVESSSLKCSDSTKEHNINQNTLGRYVEKFHQDERNEMKQSME